MRQAFIFLLMALAGPSIVLVQKSCGVGVLGYSHHNSEFYDEHTHESYANDTESYGVESDINAIIHAQLHDEWESRNYPCTSDCSGHEAGYAWAEKNNIYDSSDCDGKSQSFIEGCYAYVEEHN